MPETHKPPVRQLKFTCRHPRVPSSPTCQLPAGSVFHILVLSIPSNFLPTTNTNETPFIYSREAAGDDQSEHYVGLTVFPQDALTRELTKLGIKPATFQSELQLQRVSPAQACVGPCPGPSAGQLSAPSPGMNRCERPQREERGGRCLPHHRWTCWTFCPDWTRWRRTRGLSARLREADCPPARTEGTSQFHEHLQHNPLK